MIAAALFALAASAVDAPDAPGDHAPADVATVEARALFEEGRREYDAGRFRVARIWFERARDKQPLPELWFNIGQCDFQLGAFDDAIRHYERYLAEDPTTPNRALVLDLIDEARAARAQAPPPPSALDSALGAFVGVVPSSLRGSTPSASGARAAEEDEPWLVAGAVAGTVAVVAVGGAVAWALSQPTLGVIDAR